MVHRPLCIGKTTSQFPTARAHASFHLGAGWCRKSTDKISIFHTKWGPRLIAKLVYNYKILQISFMVVITIVRWGYKPTYNWRAPHFAFIDKSRIKTQFIICFSLARQRVTSFLFRASKIGNVQCSHWPCWLRHVLNLNSLDSAWWLQTALHHHIPCSTASDKGPDLRIHQREKSFQYQNAQAVGIPARAKASIEYQWKAQRMPKCVTWICAKRCHTLSWWYVLFYPSLGAISGRRAAAQVLTPATKICGFVTSFAPFIYLVKPGLVSACQHDAGQCRHSPHNPTAWASWWPSIDVPQFTMVPFQPWGLSRAARDAKVDEAKLRQRATTALNYSQLKPNATTWKRARLQVATVHNQEVFGRNVSVNGLALAF